MIQQKNSCTTIDYRNARYQGHVDNLGNRHNLGILIDDDLSFYVSHWDDNVLNGQTLVYISHGKYIYGSWFNNQPNGLNVFRTGDTVLVGQFRNGKIIGKILVIFQRHNIIAILQTKTQKDKFDVIECGRLLSHDDLIKFIGLLDIQMPDHYFSLIKFVTSMTSDEDENSESLLACPCESENCYFGYRDGLAIVFNSNNGVVSVGQHENKQLSGLGGKFDGKKIQEGNFELNETISYSKKRPDNQIYAIFQKMHKRSLNFKNQYFDSKVKTLGDLQSILRGNIQKIVNYNMKHGIKQATASALNDSLDYQDLNAYDSIKTAQNRQVMYEKQPIHLKKTISQYCKDDKDSKIPNKSSRQNISQKSSKNYQINYLQSNNSQIQQTVRKTPQKDSTVYYAKKSPIRYKEENNQLYGKDSKHAEKITQTSNEQLKNQRYFPRVPQRQENKIGKTYQRNNGYSRPQKSPLRPLKNSEFKINQFEGNDKIPKFGGLQMQENEKQKVSHKNSIENQVQQYKKQLQKSRSKQRPQGKSLSKYLKRPNYEDIEQRRKRLLNQFKQLNDQSSHSKLSTISDTKRATHKVSIEIEINENSIQTDKKSIAESPCMKQKKILSFTSQNQNGTQNSEQGYLPLSLINAQKIKNHRNKIIDPINQKNGSAFTKKSSVIQKLELSNKKAGKQNITYTPSSFAKYKKNIDDLKADGYTEERKHHIRNFYCQDTEQHLQEIKLTKKSQSQHFISQNQEQEQNHFSEIQLKHQKSQKVECFMDTKYVLKQKQESLRGRKQIKNQKQDIYIMKQQYGNKERVMNQRDRSPIISDVSRRKKCYKYYFDD